ncbi:MAG: GFA family protein [Pseudomonadota bacterium]
MPERLSGGCMCGAVKFTAQVEKMEMGVCHCGMCRKWAGGASMTVQCTDMSFSDEDAVAVYVSSDWGERGFCKLCGSSLFWRMRDGSFITASAQAFDAPEKFAFTHEIYIDRKPDNYAFANETETMTEADVVKMFSGGAEQ